MDYNYGQAWRADNWAQKRGPGKILVPLLVNGVKVQGLIDSGCSQTLVREWLVGSGGESRCMIYIQCIHGDIQPCPIRLVQLTVQDHTKPVQARVAKDLAYLVILRHDWKFFREDVHGWPGASVQGLKRGMEEPGGQKMAMVAKRRCHEETAPLEAKDPGEGPPSLENDFSPELNWRSEGLLPSLNLDLLSSK